MGRLSNAILPKQADNHYCGHKFASAIFLIITIISLVRSSIHLLAPDGGAGSIAGMDLSVVGADGIIFAFALWGSSQLLFAILQLIIWFRYRTLLPLMYLLLSLEFLLRMLVGRMKPVIFAHIPPGAVANWVGLPMALILLYLALPKGK